MEKPRIAILIIAHRNPGQLARLINHLKKDFSIYIHIDRNSKIRVKAENNVHCIRKYRVYWGSYNLILATRELMRIAADGEYDYYLLISGQDIPIKPNQEIIQFFNGNHNNYIMGERLAELEHHQWRMRYYHFNSYNLGKYPGKLLTFIQYKLGMLQDMLRIWRSIPADLHVGAQWFNLSHEAMTICLDKMYDSAYIDQFKLSKCSDEIVVQSILHNSALQPTIIKDDLRYTDWSKGGPHPKLLTINDYDNIINSGKLFARKFDDTVDAEIIDKLYEHIS